MAAIKPIASRVPATGFSVVLGVHGLGLSWRAAAELWKLPALIADLLQLGASSLWLALTLFFAYNYLRVRPLIDAELRDPTTVCFVALIAPGSMLTALWLAPYSAGLSFWIAAIGLIGHVVLAPWLWAKLSRGSPRTKHSLACLHLPFVTANFVAAIGATQFGYLALGTLFFGCAIGSWVIIESGIFHQLRNETLPKALRPSLGIRLSPPTLGCLAYLILNGGIPDLFAQALFGYGIFQAAVLLWSLGWIFEQSFGLEYWGFSFGITALGTASIRLSASGIHGPIKMLAIPLFAIENLVLGYLFFRTFGLLLSPRTESRTDIARRSKSVTARGH